MKSFCILLATLIVWFAVAEKGKAQILYSNSGNNTTGFVTQYGNLSFSSNGTDLIGSPGGGYVNLPVTVNGDFQMSFDVYGNSYDVDSDILFLSHGTAAGVQIRNCPQGTDTPSLYLESGTHFADYEGFYWDNTVLAQAASTNFPLQTWTSITITKIGNTLTDDVGGQILTTDLTALDLSSSLDIGLGYYATTYEGGVGQIEYRNIVIAAVPEPSTYLLVAVGISILGVLRSLRTRQH
ncbi:MAG: PEP-CTERM sorting domain-containing protein [Methylacidiphilales bacterium]|nr:PEP-CTERM sorting domain-containing protein [Candidatus Methylacidiphilales bacterium]